jgi:hypothetical protein
LRGSHLPARLVFGLLAAAMLVTCQSTPKATPTKDARTHPGISARDLMDVCWPEPGASSARVELNLVKEDGRVVDVLFDVSDLSLNSVGRCAREIAWNYPWGTDVPESLSVTPPVFRPSGWKYLAYVALVSEVEESRGLTRPGPLVRACLANGAGARPKIRYRVQTSPVRVSAFFEVESAANPMVDRRTKHDVPLTDSERCVTAVLAATAYPSSRNLELEFSDLAVAPPAAETASVALYFATPGVDPTGMVEEEALRSALGLQQQAVEACWEDALRRRAGLAGERTFRVRLDGVGRLLSTHIVPAVDRTAEAVDYILDRCLAGVLSSGKFPASGGNGAEFAYSWNFRLR